MSSNWDEFPTNIGEMAGPIARKDFTFDYKRVEVWQGGACIHSGSYEGQVQGFVQNKILHVKVDNHDLNTFINSPFTFGEISTNFDRLMWSKDIFNTSDKVERNIPDIASLFYVEGKLAKVTFTIHDPNTLVEFYN